MADSKAQRIGKRIVDAAEPGPTLYRVWDSDLKGFGLRITPQGVKSYFVIYRTDGGGRGARQREFTIGRHGPLTPEKARAEAVKLLGSVSLGHDPQGELNKARADITVEALCDLYMKEGVAMKKAATLQTDRYRIDAHIKPLIGRRPQASITGTDIERFMRDVADGKTARREKKGPRALSVVTGGKGTATRTVGLLGGIFAFAVKQGLRPTNPVRGVERYKDTHRERFLNQSEMLALGDALYAVGASGGNVAALTIIRLLALTGCRKSEIGRLRWSEIDTEHSVLRLEDSKTGQKVVPLGAAPLELLAGIARKEGPFVFPAQGKPDRAFQGVEKTWRVVREKAGLGGVRLHDLRHTYASVGLLAGYGLPIIGKLLGHADVATTSQYAHIADSPMKAAADRIAGAIFGAMKGTGAQVYDLAAARSPQRAKTK